jgi:ParB family chromosome partitioning protein
MRRKLANKALVSRLSVREVERQVRRYMADSQPRMPDRKAKLPHVADIESRMSSILGTRVRIDLRRNGKQGRLTIEFNSLDDFDRITERFGMPQEGQS